MKTIIGIDPGFMGGIAVIEAPVLGTDEVVHAFTMPILTTKKPPRKGKKSMRTEFSYDGPNIRWAFKLGWEVESIAYIEKQQARPRFDRSLWNPVTKKFGKMVNPSIQSTQNLFDGYGLLRGVLIGLGIPFVEVPPKVWQAVMFVEFEGTVIQDTKAASIQIAQRMFPDLDLRRSPRCKTPHDGICDALMIAEYGRRVEGGEIV